jgi:subtilisin family serine protease
MAQLGLNAGSSVTPAIPACDVVSPARSPMPCGIIVIDTDPDQKTIDVIDLLTVVGARSHHVFAAANAAAGRVQHPSVLADLLRLPGIQVIPDRAVRALARPGGNKGGSGGTTLQTVPAGVSRIGAVPGALAVKGQGVGVAIVDTGLDFAHADLAVVAACYDALGGNCQDQNGHGTHVGGIVAALDNSVDVVGVAPAAALYAVRVLDAQGSGSDSDVMAGLQWIIDNASRQAVPIQVVNMSLGRPGTLGDNPAMRSLVQTLRAMGISVVVAAGNDASQEIAAMVPAAYPEVMAVASTSAANGANKCRGYAGFIAADTASYFTTDGNAVVVSAPGERQEDISRGCQLSSQGILSLKLGGGTTRASGTSMAAPHVTGVIALLLEQGGSGLSGADLVDYIQTILQSSAGRIGTAPADSPTAGYSFDGVREGVVSACAVLGAC